MSRHDLPMLARRTFQRVTIALVLASSACAALARQADPPEAPGAKTAAAPAAIAPDTSPQVTEGIVNAPVAELWRVFSTSEGFKALGVAQCDLDLRPGGLIRAAYDPKATLGAPDTIQNRILAYEPERMLAFRIDRPPTGFPYPNAWKNTWSVVLLTDLGDGRTDVRLTGMGYTADEESQKMRSFFTAGNGWVMKKLQSRYDASKAPDPAIAAHAPIPPDPLVPIELDEVVNAPREDVFKEYTTSAGWKSFFGVESTIELRPGGPFEIYFGAENPVGQRGSEGCIVLSYIPGRMFSYTWNAPPKFPEARAERTWVVITFEDAGTGRTKIRLNHLGFAEQAAKHPEQSEQWRNVRAYFANAWPMVFTQLAHQHQPALPAN